MKKKYINTIGTLVAFAISVMAGILTNSTPPNIRAKIDVFFGRYPEIWIGVIVFVFVVLLMNILLVQYRKSTLSKNLEKKEEHEENRKLFIRHLEKRYQQKILQKTDERFSPPMELIYTKEGINENHTIFLDDEARTESEVCEELAMLLNRYKHLLIIGLAGVGKTVRLHEMALGLLKDALDNTLVPIPVIFNLSTWTEDYANLEEWFIDYLVKNYNVPPNANIKELVIGKHIIPLLDGFDEIGYYYDNNGDKDKLREKCLEAIHDYRNLRYNPMFVICSRNVEYVNAGGNMAVNAQIEIKKLEEDRIIKILDDIILASNSGVYSNSNDNVAKNLKAHIDKTPALLKVLCIPFYFNALFQVLNKRGDELINFPNKEDKIKDFIVEIYIKRKSKRNNISALGHHLSWLTQWIKRKKRISFNLTDFDESCLYNPKSFAIIRSFITVCFGISLFFYLFAGLPIMWSLATAFVFFIIGGGFKYEEEKDAKIIVEEVIKNEKDIENDEDSKFQYHWKRWYRALAFGVFSGIYFWLVFGILKGLLCAVIVALVYRLFVAIFNTSSPFIGFGIQRHRLEYHSRKDELRRWNWKELLTIDFWTHTIFEMYLLSILLGLIFALFIKIFGTDWRVGLVTGTIFGLTYAFWSSLEHRANQIKYYNDKADKPMKRLLHGLFVRMAVFGFSYSIAKFFICLYSGEEMRTSLTSSLIAGLLGILAALIESLFFKNLIVNLIIWFEGKLPFPMSTFFNNCVKSHILETENSSWKFSHQIISQYFVDNFSKPKEIKELENIYNINLKELEEGSVWEHKNTYKLDQYGHVVGLNLSNNGIDKIKGINSLTKLQELNLSKNNISEIESWSFFDSTRLKRLQILDLSNNKLSAIENLDTLTSLQILNLSNNLIKDISLIPFIFKRLEYLFIQSNQISAISNMNDFLCMKYLHNLSIENNPVERKENISIHIDKIERRTNFLSFLLIIVLRCLRNPMSFKKRLKNEESYIAYFNKVKNHLMI